MLMLAYSFYTPEHFILYSLASNKYLRKVFNTLPYIKGIKYP